MYFVLIEKISMKDKYTLINIFKTSILILRMEECQRGAW